MDCLPEGEFAVTDHGRAGVEQALLRFGDIEELQGTWGEVRFGKLGNKRGGDVLDLGLGDHIFIFPLHHGHLDMR